MATTLAGSVALALAATAFTAIPSQAAEGRPLTASTVASLQAGGVLPKISKKPTLDGSKSLSDQDGWSFATNAGVDFAVNADGELRLSNATTSGVIDQLVSPALDVPASESAGYDRFDAEFTVASATGGFQPGLRIEVAPDNGHGSRSGGTFTLWHNPATEKLEIGAVWSNPQGGWSNTTLAAVDPTQAHTIRISERFVVNGTDVADVYVDGAFAGRVGTYERYEGSGQGSISSLLFRASQAVPNASGADWDVQPAVPGTEGAGFLISDLSYSAEATEARSLNRVAVTAASHVKSLDFFQVDETRSAGHNELTADGLHVWTDDSSSNAKAAMYRALPKAMPLAEVGQPTMTFADGATGALPGLQLGIDRDGNGTWDGYLVQEGDTYGGGTWWTNKDYFGVPSGGGYASLGTLDDYLTANPQAQVLSFGYSLGSGVQGDATISSITVANTRYTFAKEIASSVSASPVKQVAGATAVLPVVVNPGASTGTVTVTKGSTTLGTASVVNGKANVTLAAGKLAVGAHTVQVAYSGSSTTAASTTTAKVTVSKSAATMSAKWSSARYGTAATVDVTVKGAAGDATGKVEVREGSKVLATKTLANGKATVSLPKSLSVGKHPLSLRYLGSSTVDAKSASKTLTVSKATSKSAVKLSSSKVKPSQRAKTTVTVTAPNLKPNGKATIVIQSQSGKVVNVDVTVKNGKVTKSLPRLLAGRYKVSVTFAGSSTISSSTSAASNLTVTW
ncbi:Ig-like domain-containing protein [Cellulomonas alba]|uniref:Ig-like domain-containing protein n=1 Tax=Cellulomonas alba TaxID=3053467 RepID=A0ABT7SHT1_9CELL|nr:Ig-like domain-containing protein [Cellulomonas alba]MDM7855746.1 Ig-like domain-containing protein [Cellulomonas alba]